MYFGENTVQAYIMEGWFKNLTDKLFKKKSITENPKNKLAQKSKDLNSKNIKANSDQIKLNFKAASADDLRKIYNSDGIAIEGVDFMQAKSSQEMINAIIEKFADNYCYLKDGCNIVVGSGKVINKTYDLEGDNSYDDNFHITLISFNDVTFDHNKVDWGSFKSKVSCRWWRDIVDNNEYREYKKGRHKASSQIQWLIDAYEK